MKRCLLSIAVSLVVAGGGVSSVGAQQIEATPEAKATTLDAMIVTGTRGSNRTQFDTLAPVDVFSQEEIRAHRVRRPG